MKDGNEYNKKFYYLNKNKKLKKMTIQYKFNRNQKEQWRFVKIQKINKSVM